MLIRARLDARVMEAILARRTVSSPVDGVVVERFLSAGELVNRAGSGDGVRIAQVHPLKIDVIAPLSLFGQIKEGQAALVSPEDPIGGVHEATVKVVDSLIDAASGTFRIRLELPNEDMSVPSGIRCRVQFQD
ncbi:MAG: efflux RND transporter periplasmic adaptor subunit [Planctomycetes bacterium]|nr:efflux RND transporter periplasmic adaptor subunit [Planctomycetota bacterium]